MKTKPLQVWEFQNTHTGEKYRVKAIDGHTAWLAHHTKHSPNERAWQVKAVCPCGNPSAHAYCSKRCYWLFD